MQPVHLLASITSHIQPCAPLPMYTVSDLTWIASAYFLPQGKLNPLQTQQLTES